MTANYGLVANTINSLADRVHGLSQDRLAHDERMGSLGLTRARLAAEQQGLTGQRDVQMAKLEYEKYLDEPVMLGDAIKSSKLPDERKQVILSGMDPRMASIPTTRREVFNTYTQAQQNIQSARQKEDERRFTEKENRLNRESLEKRDKLNRRSQETIASQRTASERDTRPNMQKEVEFIAQTMGATPQEALKQYREDKTLGERIRLYNNELDRLAEDFDFQDLEPGQKAQKVDQLRQSFQIPVKQQNEKPAMELTREKAIDYLRQTNGDREKAKKLAAQDGYQF